MSPLAIRAVSVLVVLHAMAPLEAGVCGDPPHVLVLKRTKAGYEIEKLRFEAGPVSVRVLSANEATGIIDVIVPPGPGQSGAVSKFGDSRTITVTHAAGRLLVSTKYANGKEYEQPAQQLDDLVKQDIRVSVSGADGTCGAFLIEEYERVVPDQAGPVVDPLAGKVHMGKGDFVVHTYTYRHDPGAPVVGVAALEHDRWPFVEVQLPDGREGRLIVDTAASHTVVTSTLLPEGTEIEKVSMVQHANATKKLLSPDLEGATGRVGAVLGRAELSQLRIGGISFSNASVIVLEELPDLFGRPIAGILGLDLLRRCETLSLGYLTDEHSPPVLRLGQEIAVADSDALELPFALVKTHLMVKGAVNDIAVYFIVDTGSQDSFLDGAAAEAGGLEVDENDSGRVRGLGGEAKAAPRSHGGTLRFAGRTYDDVPFRVSPLDGFSSLRGHDQKIGLLGNSFFERFDRIEIDFHRRRIRFVETP